MSKVEQIEAEIAKLSPEEVRQLVRWLAARDAEIWDEEMEEDAKTGRLDRLWQEAEKEIGTGETRPLDDLIDNP